MAPMPPKLPIAVLISGSGSNLQALIDAANDDAFGCSIVGVISDRREAFGLVRAQRVGIPTTVVAWSDFGDRESFTEATVDAARTFGAKALVLAGFMRILAASAIEAYPNAIINVHPALLPLFPGANAIEQALEAGVAETGVTVHFVDELVDHGPVIAQQSVPVVDGDTPDTVRSRIQGVEHLLLPRVVSAFGRGDITVDASGVVWHNDLEAVAP